MKRLTTEEMQTISDALYTAILCRRTHSEKREEYIKVHDKVRLLARGKESREILMARISDLTFEELGELKVAIDERTERGGKGK